MSDTRQHVHDLIDRLPPPQLDAIAGLLEAMLDPTATKHTSREEITEEEERAVDEAKNWLRENEGKGIPHEEVLSDFGLTLDDFQRMGERRARRRRS